MGCVGPLTGPIDGVFPVPGSKSLANRALVAAALAGDSEVRNVPDGDDCAAMVEALRVLEAGIVVDGGTVFVGRPVNRERRSAVTVDARLAGTTSRFLIGLCAQIAGPTTVTGQPALARRPMSDLVDGLKRLGASVSNADGHLPVTVERGDVRGGRLEVPANVSSQFISSLMLMAPYLDGGLEITIPGDTVSASYLRLTAEVMRAFGREASIGSSSIVVAEGTYRPTVYEVPPDASSASYPLLLVALHGGSVRVPRLGTASSQGDWRFSSILEMCGCNVRHEGDDVVVTRDRATPLRPVDVDMRECSDLVPTVAVLATHLAGRSVLRGIGFVRNKESDRIGDLARELRALGAVVVETEDGLEIEQSPLHGGLVDTHHDHRLGMAFGVLGTIVPGIEIDDPTVVSKSWPSFWEDLGITTSI